MNAVRKPVRLHRNNNNATADNPIMKYAILKQNLIFAPISSDSEDKTKKLETGI